MNDVFALMSRIAEGPSVAAVWELGTGYFGRLGFQRCNYGFTRFRGENSVGDPDDALFLTTCDPSYAQFYFRNGFFSRTPAFRWAQHNVGACTWAWVREAYLAGRLSTDEAETVRQNAAIGILAGISVSFPETSSRAKGALGLIADPGISVEAVDALFARQKDELIAVANMMHLRIIQLPFPIRRRPLTERQREALEWVADGKTTQDVALLMEVSPAMVEKHLRLAREALAVDTTTQAVAKAALMNLIFQQPPRPANGAAL
ncbi:helix-turn-helix transcriptional regulator [Tabrizicola oligotrophica]|uniref:LuxR family transcriptional regulator n=1 Tax=Tabrizicola oligotrophica TaxID=2710650 RepID=A0A6M0QQT1_9RHOB|nr:LuxR family transcriptional regulator [Tabrizicola oligotrophica]NEY89023.1 LuxR family transcriptional regulator [Tabrizicola oligotrophica]